MEYRTSHKVYSAWNYEKEIEDLNRASEEGWQLVRGGCFHSRFVKNDSVRYRYQLDFGKIEDLPRYIETFREQGWEYMNSTFNGWHYLRKAYDPSLPEEEYEIFTDRESLKEMNGRWSRIALGIGIVLALFTVLYAIRIFREPNIPHLFQFLIFAVEAVVLIRGGLIMRDPDTSKSRRGDGALFATFLLVIVIGCAGMIATESLRPHAGATSQAASIDAPIEDQQWTYFDVKYTDNYYLDLTIEGYDPVTVSIADDAGNQVFSKTAQNLFEEKGIKVRLKPGHYWCTISAESGYSVEYRIS